MDSDGSSALGSFSRGFMGCMGVAAAVFLLAIVGLEMCRYGLPNSTGSQASAGSITDGGFCASAMVQAQNAAIIPRSTQLSLSEPKELKIVANRVQCIVNDGDVYYQLTYDLACDQVLEAKCVGVVSVVRATDGAILFVKPS